MRLPLLSLACLCVGFLACASTGGDVPKGGTIAKPKTANGFVSNAQVPGMVIAEARFPAGHAQVFGAADRPQGRVSVQRDLRIDVIEDAGLVPIFVKIGLPSRSDAEQDVQLTPEQMEFRLTLQDGTVLEAVPAESAAKDDEDLTAVLAEQALQHGFLKLSGGVKEGYVYFRLAPKDEFEYDDGKLEHVVGPVRREIDLSRSLLSFKVTRGGQATPFFIGVMR